MESVGAYEAKTHLPALLERVLKGEEITITRHGVPIAKLVPHSAPARRPVQDVIQDLCENRKSMRLDGLTIRSLIEEGRL